MKMRRWLIVWVVCLVACQGTSGRGAPAATTTTAAGPTVAVAQPTAVISPPTREPRSSATPRVTAAPSATLVPSPTVAPTVAPSAYQLAALSGDGVLTVFNADGSNAHKLLDSHIVTGQTAGFGFSPDGKWVALEQIVGGPNTHLFAVRLSDTTVVDLGLADRYVVPGLILWQ
jgi:hypothetical protein